MSSLRDLQRLSISDIAKTRKQHQTLKLSNPQSLKPKSQLLNSSTPQLLSLSASSPVTTFK